MIKNYLLPAVRKAVKQITAERNKIPEDRSGISIRAISMVDVACVMAGSSILREGMRRPVWSEPKLGRHALSS